LIGTNAQCAGKTLSGGGTLTVQVTGTNPNGTTSGGVPASGVTAVILNVTVTNPTALGYLTAWPTGSSRPLASNLNWTVGQTVPNRVEVPVGTGGTISLYNSAGTADVIVDVGGYYSSSASASAPGSYFSGFTPARICDTRGGNPSALSGSADQCLGKALGAATTLHVQVSGVGGVPGEFTSTPAVAVILNVTVTNPTAPGYLTVWPTGSARPVASDLNWVTGQTIANLVPVTIGTGGQVSIYNSAGSTDVVIDVVGYESGTNVVPPSTVALSTQSLNLLSAVAADQSSLTFSATDAQLDALVPGDVMTSGSTTLAPAGFMAVVTGLTNHDGGLVVTTTPASLTQVAPQGSFGLVGAPMNLLSPPTNITSDFKKAKGSPQSTPHANSAEESPTPNDMDQFLQSVSCGANANPPMINYSAGFTNFTVTPYFSASWSWGVPPSVSISTSLRLDETFAASASISESGADSVSVSCTTSAPIPGLNNLELSDPIPITIGPVDFTLTPVLQASLGVTATGSLSGTASFSATQSAYASAGVNYNGGFTPTGGTGCDPPVPSGTPLCTVASTANTSLQPSLSLGVGPSFSLVGAVDAVTSDCDSDTDFCYVGGPVIGPELTIGLDLEGTLQPTAPIWAVGLNLTIGVGFTANWTVGPITLNLTYQHNLVNATDILDHAIEVDTTSLPEARGAALYLATLAASGGSTPYTWAFASDGPSPPPWVSLSVDGVLSGIPPPSTTTQNTTIDVAVTDSSFPSITATQTLTLTLGPGTPIITDFTASPSVLPAAGGTTTLTWNAINATSCTVTSSPPVSGLPTGAPCETASGGSETAKVSLPPSAMTGVYTFTLTASGASGTTPTSQNTRTVVGASSPTNWTEESIPKSSNLSGVSCASINVCVAVGYNPSYTAGASWFTTDGGMSWTTVTVPRADNLYNVSCASTSDCVAVGSSGTTGAAWVTTDGGTSWKRVGVSSANSLFSVSCASTEDCVVSGIESDTAFTPAIWVTTDGGTSWTEEAVSNENGSGTVSCASTTDCVMVAPDLTTDLGAAWVTTDGGTSWTEETVTNAPSNAFASVSCATVNDCVAVDDLPNTRQGQVGAAWVTTSGGTSWTEETVSSAYELNTIWCAAPQDCVAFGLDGTTLASAAWVTTDGGIKWTEETVPGVSGSEGTTVTGVSCAAPGDCTAVGDAAFEGPSTGFAWIGR
jgi:photosystem II stability/assembly factor-like uncharacterized protein